MANPQPVPLPTGLSGGKSPEAFRTISEVAAELDLPQHVGDLPEDLDAPVLSVCQRGNISLSGVLYLQSLGYRNARSVTGGTNAWLERGFTTESA